MKKYKKVVGFGGDDSKLAIKNTLSNKNMSKTKMFGLEIIADCF